MSEPQAVRSLGAILAIDIVGYSRQMGRDEESTLRRLQEYRDLTAQIVARHGGRVFGVAGDSEMAVMPGALEALECALAIQDDIAERNAGLPEERRMPLRIGINFGKVLIEGEGVYGDDVNIAARAEALAGKGGICVTGAVFDRVNGELPLGYEDYGPQRFKNIDRRIRTLRVRREPLMVGRVVPGRPPIPRSRWRKVAAAALLAVAGASAWNFYLQDQVSEWQTTAAERAAAVEAGRERAQALLVSLQHAESRVSAERARAAELLAGLLAAERAAAERARSVQAATRAEAERAAAEGERAQALLASLQDAEARASAEQARADGLLAALRETEAQAAAARDAAVRRKIEERAAARGRAAALLASWQAAERQAAAERKRVQRLIAALDSAQARAREEAQAAAQRAATRAEAERATAEERARAEALVAALQAAERKAAEELRKGESLMASIEATEGAPARARVQALLDSLQVAGQSAATERKRAELLITSWKAPEGGIEPSQARAEEDAARRALEERGAERHRAEALLGLWQDAETTAATERARAEALLTALREADERGAIERAAVPRRKPAQPVQSQAEDAAPEAEALTPAPVEPEDATAAPDAPDQFAALPGQPEATDAALSQEGGKTVAPERDEPSLDAVARLLRERRQEFREKFWAYHKTRVGSASSRLPRAFKLWEARVLGIENGAYKIRVAFEPKNRTHYIAAGVAVVIVLLKIAGNDFEIVGHSYANSVGTKRAGQQAALSNQSEASDAPLAKSDGDSAAPESESASLEVVERLLRERKDDLLDHIRVYLDARPEIYSPERPGIFRILDLKALWHAGGTYKMRVVYEDRISRTTKTYVYPKIRILDLFLELDGDDFEIVGHELPPALHREQAASLPEQRLQPMTVETAERAVP